LSGRNELDIGSKQTFCIALEPLESPHDTRIVWFINGSARSTRKDPHLSSVRWHWDFANHISTKVTFLKDGLQSDRNFDFILFRVLLNNRHYFERQVNVLTDSIGHDVEDSVRGNEGDTAVTIKSAKSHALVELNVVDLDSFVGPLR